MSECTACNGSGHYDHDGAPPCAACGGTGRAAPAPIEWECLECGYDRDESGGLPPPDICPICAGDTGHDGRIITKPQKEKNNG